MSNQAQAKAPPSGIIHFPIPTPVIVNGDSLTAQTACLRFATGTTTDIVSVRLYDGEKPLQFFDGINLTGSWELWKGELTNVRKIQWGVTMTVAFQFNGMEVGAEDWVQFVGAGVDFYS